MDIKINSENKLFWEGCKKKQLFLQKCSNCGKIRWPYSIACPECYSFKWEVVESKGKGKIYSYAVYYIPFDKEFKNKVPYIVAIISLNEGVKFFSNIVNSDINNIHCGQSVEVIWEKEGEYFIPKFRLM